VSDSAAAASGATIAAARPPGRAASSQVRQAPGGSYQSTLAAMSLRVVRANESCFNS